MYPQHPPPDPGPPPGEDPPQKWCNPCLSTPPLCKGVSAVEGFGVCFWITFKGRGCITFVVYPPLVVAQGRAEGAGDTCNYGQCMDQFPQNTIKVIREFERIQKKICRHKMSIMFNEICINEEMLPKYTYFKLYIIYMFQQNLVLNNPEGLICYKTQSNHYRF